MKPEIKKYLRRGEDDTLDYKQEISSPYKIAKTMSSFANHKGGVLLVGVRDNKSIAGIRSEDEKYMLDLAATMYCKPEIKLKIIEHQIDNKVVLECHVPEGDMKPYYAKDNDGKWWVYIRVKDNSLLASKVVVEVLKNQTANRGVFIKYGKNEDALIKYLKTHERITLMEFKKLVNISKQRATRILVKMVSSGVLRNHTYEKTEFFTMS